MTANPEEMLKSGERTGLIIVAHPDDESIGATGLMLRLHRCQLIHVTDGAPRDQRFWAGSQVDSRAEYARVRRSELTRALALIGIEPRCASGLGVVDQEVAMVLGAIAQRLASAITALRPDFVVTHAYEGGHPDHDALAFAVWAAGRLIAKQGGTMPPVFEMAMYHGEPGERVVGRFLSRPEVPEIELELTADEKRLKQAILECFDSQREVLAPFREHEVERFRPAPSYDFTQPPHQGPLLYEQRGFPMSGVQWRELVAKALRGLDMAGKQARERGAARDHKAVDARHGQDSAAQEVGGVEGVGGAGGAMQSDRGRERGPDEDQDRARSPQSQAGQQTGSRSGDQAGDQASDQAGNRPGNRPGDQPIDEPGDEPPMELPGKEAPDERRAASGDQHDTAQSMRERPREQSLGEGRAEMSNGDGKNSDNHPDEARP